MNISTAPKQNIGGEKVAQIICNNSRVAIRFAKLQLHSTLAIFGTLEKFCKRTTKFVDNLKPCKFSVTYRERNK